jgi:soluble lytic murein transglycosylase
METVLTPLAPAAFLRRARRLALALAVVAGPSCAPAAGGPLAPGTVAAAPDAPVSAGVPGPEASKAAAEPRRPAAAPGEKARAAVAEGPPFTEADVAPLFPGGPLARARADFAAGRWDAAAEGFGASRTPHARYVAGVALVEARRGAQALEKLAALERELPAIADRVALWRGRAHQAAGDGRAAAVAFAAVPADSLLWGEAQLSRARSLEGAGDRAGALDALAPVLSLAPPEDTTRGDPAAEALLLTGRLRAASRSKADLAWARRAFLDCWAGHPLSGVAASCLQELKKLPAPSSAPPAAEDTLRHAEALLDANRNAAALAELAKLTPALPGPGPGEAVACRAWFALGKAHRKERQHSKAIETLRPVVERCDDPQLRVRAVYVLASSSSIVDPEAGVAWYRALARDYPAHPFADDALFYAADLLARAGRTGEALATLADLSERYPRGDFRAEALFRSAWIEREAGHLAGALGALSRIERDYAESDAYEHARAVYWKARILMERGAEGDAAQSVEAWRSLAERHPTDYYGLLARARLEEARPGSAPAWPRPERAVEAKGFRYQPGALANDRHFRAGVLLLRMGLERAAADELGAVDRKALATGDALLLAAELLDRAGDHRASTRLVRSLGRAALRQKPEGPALRVWRVAYPSAFRDEVERWAPAAGVPSELLLALMREESGLDPAAISGAGAVGLTQLMLPTAQGVARQLKMRKVRQADLMQPDVSIRIGATYFGGLLRRYRSEALALAAYNAGDAPVRRWLKARGSLPLDAFVEEIPIQETRGYVKRVLRSYAAYRFLYGPGGSSPLLLSQALPQLQ